MKCARSSNRCCLSLQWICVSEYLIDHQTIIRISIYDVRARWILVDQFNRRPPVDRITEEARSNRNVNLIRAHRHVWVMCHGQLFYPSISVITFCRCIARHWWFPLSYYSTPYLCYKYTLQLYHTTNYFSLLIKKPVCKKIHHSRVFVACEEL